MGENAGVLDIGDGWAVTFKVESHNHPSFIEPFQGAATGVGGIVRDIISMGARPVAVMDQLRFGAIDDPDTARVVNGVVSGISLLRQLPGPAEHRRRDLLRRGVPGQPARQRARGRRAAARGPAPGQRARRGQQGRAVRCAHRRRRHRRRIHPRLATRSPRAADQAPGGAGGRPVRREGAHRVLPRAVRRRPGRGHPGSRRRRHQLRHLASWPRTATAACRSSWTRCCCATRPHRRGDPDEREPGADDGDRHAREARRLPRGHRQVGRGDQRARRGHRHRPAHHQLARRADRQRRAAHRRGGRPGVRPARRLPGLDRRAAGGLRLPAPPGELARRAARPVPRAARQPEPRRQGLDHRPVRPLRRRQHRAQLPGRRRHGARRRGERARLRPGRGCQRPLRATRPVPGRAARPRRGVPQRRRDRRRPGRGERLPQLRLAGEPRGDVAVLPGRRGPVRRLPGTGDPGHRRQRVVLQPDRRHPDPPDAGRRGARRHPRRRPRASRPAGRTRATTSTCSASRATSWTAPRGRM